MNPSETDTALAAIQDRLNSPDWNPGLFSILAISTSPAPDDTLDLVVSLKDSATGLVYSPTLGSWTTDELAAATQPDSIGGLGDILHGLLLEWWDLDRPRRP